jgi:hypothetical protein
MIPVPPPFVKKGTKEQNTLPSYCRLTEKQPCPDPASSSIGSHSHVLVSQTWKRIRGLLLQTAPPGCTKLAYIFLEGRKRHFLQLSSTWRDLRIHIINLCLTRPCRVAKFAEFISNGFEALTVHADRSISLLRLSKFYVEAVDVGVDVVFRSFAWRLVAACQKTRLKILVETRA